MFNTAKYLPLCLDSILEQTEKDWELIAVNDFSKDESEEILRKYASKDKRIKVFNNVKKGIIPALQLAYAKSNGGYITRMDSDDIMSPIKLKALKDLLDNKTPNYVATGKVKYFSEQPLGEGYKKYEQWLNDLGANRYHEIYRECVIPSPCWMVHRTAFERCGAFESERYPEDYDLCFRFYMNDLEVLFSPEILHLWRDRPDRISRTGEHYADNAFLELKLDYYLQIDTLKSSPYILWGAGKKGKKIAQMLLKRKVPFTWVTNNQRKRTVPIYGVQLHAPEVLLKIKNPQIIIAVANPLEQSQIRNYLYENEIDDVEYNYVFFC